MNAINFETHMKPIQLHIMMLHYFLYANMWVESHQNLYSKSTQDSSTDASIAMLRKL